MNVLTDYLPEAVEIDGKVYDLDTDFRTGIDIMIAFEDPELITNEKMAVMIHLLYKGIPENLEEACRQGIKFLDCGEEVREGSSTGSEPDRLYSFAKDSRYIYSAIKQSHGIDLEEVEYLHWWKFSYMFLDLREDCLFRQIIDLRQRRLRGKLTVEERNAWAERADILELPEYISPEEKAAGDEFMRLLNGG